MHGSRVHPDQPSGGASPKPPERGSAAVSDEAGGGVRYQSTDVRRAVDFYTKHLDFTLKHH
jgi:hypothetical protein